MNTNIQSWPAQTVSFAQIDLAYGMSGGGTTAFSKMFFEGCPTAFPLTAILRTEGRNTKIGQNTLFFFFVGLKISCFIHPCGSSINKTSF